MKINNEEHNHNHDGHGHGIVEELLHHIPYAIIAVALSMIVLSFLSYSGNEEGVNTVMTYLLFHNFHFLHILFAGTGTMLTFKKHSKSTLFGIILSTIIPILFCTLSDALLPFLGGKLLGLEMELHWCLLHHLQTILPFLFVGVFNGWIMSMHMPTSHLFYSVGSHFAHIFISSMASILYLVSFGFDYWWIQMGFVFVYMILVVLIPCTLTDIVVPSLFGRIKTKRRK
jgi:hypothetical protein